MSRVVRLRNSSEFRTVYASGKRYDGCLMTVFVLSNNSGNHRLGITASRKVARHAVDRNRVKRLLREAFRLSVAERSSIQPGRDWVLNAKRSLLKVKVASVLEELRKITLQVSSGKMEGAAVPTAVE